MNLDTVEKIVGYPSCESLSISELPYSKSCSEQLQTLQMFSKRDSHPNFGLNDRRNPKSNFILVIKSKLSFSDEDRCGLCDSKSTIYFSKYIHNYIIDKIIKMVEDDLQKAKSDYLSAENKVICFLENLY